MSLEGTVVVGDDGIAGKGGAVDPTSLKTVQMTNAVLITLLFDSFNRHDSLVFLEKEVNRLFNPHPSPF